LDGRYRKFRAMGRAGQAFVDDGTPPAEPANGPAEPEAETEAGQGR